MNWYTIFRLLVTFYLYLESQKSCRIWWHCGMNRYLFLAIDRIFKKKKTYVQPPNQNRLFLLHGHC